MGVHDNLTGTVDVGAVETPQSQIARGKTLKKKCTDMCFVSAMTSDGNQVTYVKLGRAQGLPTDDSDNRTQQKVYERDKSCGYSGGRQITSASKNAHCSRTP